MNRIRANVVYFGVIGTLVAILASTPALAFNSPTHEQLVRSLFTYLQTHPHRSLATAQWFSTGKQGDQDVLQDLLIRATIDADYHQDVWLGALFHAPFVGVMTKYASFFGAFSHHLNLAVPGVYWENDGYAFLNTSGTGNDAYLGFPTVTVLGERSPALGGIDLAHPTHGIEVGALRLGFRGTDEDWKRLYSAGNWSGNAVFPPATVLGQLSYNALLGSEPAKKTWDDRWTDTFPLIAGFLDETQLTRDYRRTEIAGLPRGMDLLGTVLHLAQDLSVPHHTQGIVAFCHPELETLVDQLACGQDQVDPTRYDQGTFDEGTNPYGHCQKLYDPELVGSILGSVPAVSPLRMLTVADRLREIAQITFKWKWGPGSGEQIWSQLPDGTEYTASNCGQVLAKPGVKQQLKFQYNLAVAASVTLFESAAIEYESRIPR